jgi:hypothetical protein
VKNATEADQLAMKNNPDYYEVSWYMRFKKAGK